MPKANAKQVRYHRWLIEENLCACGCGMQAAIVHHPLQEHPDQGTRRNHEYVVPMHWQCHDTLHRKAGSDQYAEAAAQYRQQGIDAGLLDA